MYEKNNCQALDHPSQGAVQQEFLQYTNNNGVMTHPIWELRNRLPMFEHCQHDSLKNTIWLADRICKCTE